MKIFSDKKGESDDTLWAVLIRLVSSIGAIIVALAIILMLYFVIFPGNQCLESAKLKVDRLEGDILSERVKETPIQFYSKDEDCKFNIITKEGKSEICLEAVNLNNNGDCREVKKVVFSDSTTLPFFSKTADETFEVSIKRDNGKISLSREG